MAALSYKDLFSSEFECGPALYLSTVDSGSTGVGFFTRPDYLAQYRTGSDRVCGGVFFAGRDGWSQLGVQLLGATVITAFTAACRWASGYLPLWKACLVSQHDRCGRWMRSDIAERNPSINALLGAYRWGFESFAP